MKRKRGVRERIGDFLRKHPNKYTTKQIAERFFPENPTANIDRASGIISREGVRPLTLNGRSVLSQETAMKPKDKVQHDLALSRLRDGKKVTEAGYKIALRKISDLEREKEALLSIKDGAKSFVIKPNKKVESEAVAVWLASDWHVGEKVTQGQTNGINEYNPSIAKERGTLFFTNGLKLTKLQGQGVTIKTIVLALLGDFITNHLHIDAVENNYLPPVEETMFAQELIISGIEYILKNSDYQLVVPCHSGNHGRTTKYSHFGSENGHSLEYFMYHSIANYFKDEPRVKIIIPEGAHSYVEVYGRNIRFLHGHDVKFNGGVGGLTTPLNKAIAQWDKARPAFLTCLGHFHQRFDGGNFICNGSLIGYNAFALSIKASAERPQQTFLLVDRENGKTIVAPILVEAPA